jgi:pimeloyl-ACP methyl ester carboxylesterase
VGDYVEVGGRRTWVDTWGEGPPVVLLHGDLSPNATSEPLVPALSEHFRVTALERRGHGRTPDVDGPFGYGIFADDTIEFIQAEIGGPADLVGYSGGGNIALIVAMRRPDLVRRLVPISANFRVDGVVLEMAAEGSAMAPDSPQFAFLGELYASLSPDGPEHWAVVFDKDMRMMMSEPEIEPAELGAITAPSLVVASDDDLIRLEHSIELYRSIPNSELAIVPGTSHALVFEKPELVGRLVADFLRNDPAPTLMPFRRATADGAPL